MTLITLVEGRALTGDAQGAAAALAELDALPMPNVHIWDPEAGRARAWTAVAQGDIPAARASLTDAARQAAERGDWVVEAAALHDLARLGTAVPVVERLEELKGVVEGPFVAARARHARALVANDALSLAAVSEEFERLGARLLAAEAATDSAAAWRRSGEARKAMRVERQAAELAGRCEGAKTPTLTTTPARASLTGREFEIVLLAAAGKANKEIADQLGLSVRTVENKLYSAYEKLGVSSRAELPGVIHDL